MKNTIFTVGSFTYKVIADAEFIKMFGEAQKYRDNTYRVLDALYIYLQGCREEGDVIADLWDINFDECFDDDYCYVPESALATTMEHIEEFKNYEVERFFKAILNGNILPDGEDKE
jgi:hypothetical protein